MVLNNVLLNVGESTTQIDHIVISRSGLFVIETKNYKGWIYGHENSEYWKQILFSNGYSFKNPINQNNVHVYALKRILLGYPQIKYFPIVVFSGGAVLKNVTNWSPGIYSNRLLRTIREQDCESNLSFDQMQAIYDQLDKLRLKSGLEGSKHVKMVKKKIQESRQNLTAETCPNCGSYLIKRKGKFGEFLGCSNFPQCSYTINISKNL
ncbi:NERD domain-containing protein [Algoriphagus sp. A40]|uniref:nuclease-related domain-containing protein n=1 Tax=Algoriphagus sp. A40 TaxID=1945863 RepID=UPI00352F7D68